MPAGGSVRRADRLFEIIQFMRRKDLVRARDLSDALEVSERTIYRDIQDLITSGVPIEGEAGVGYVLKAGFDLPPLMFKEQEIEALVLGARIVQSWADPELAAAATDVIAKVRGGHSRPAAQLHGQHRAAGAVAPLHGDDQLRRGGAAPRAAQPAEGAFPLSQCAGRAIRAHGAAAVPGIFRPVWLLSAWCELRDDFRTFRLDRIDGFAVQADRFRLEPGKTLHDFLKRDQTWTRGYGAAPNT